MSSMSASRDSIDDVGGDALRRIFLAEGSPTVSVIPISLFFFFCGEGGGGERPFCMSQRLLGFYLNDLVLNLFAIEY